MPKRPSWMSDPDERKQSRVSMNFEVNLVYKGAFIKGRYVDFSEDGIRIGMKGNPGFAAGDEIEFSLGNYELQGKVIWAESSDDEHILGIKVVGDRWPVVYPLICPGGN